MASNIFLNLLQHVPEAIVWTTVFAILYAVATAIYNLTLHPLRHFPGPILWRSARLPYMISMWSGRLHVRMFQHHEKYGPIVRIAPNELCFADSAAIDDIYSNRGAQISFPKTPIWHAPLPGKPPSIVNVLDREHHGRMRKQMEPGFSEKAVMGQETIVQRNVTQLITRFQEQVTAAKSTGNKSTIVDLPTWLTFVLLDIVGDLLFGESFGCLESHTMDEWMGLMFGSLKAMLLFTSLRHYTLITWILDFLTARKAKEMLDKHWGIAEEKVNKRLKKKSFRADFIDLWQMDRKGKAGLTLGEVNANAMPMMLAGSETVTTTLMGTFAWLVKCPDQLERVKREVRSSFEREEDITFAKIRQLPYLNAVIWEGQRMCAPLPISVWRITPPEGGKVCGHWIAGDTIVSINLQALHLDKDRFHDSKSFHAERWLPEAATDTSSPFFKDDRAALQPFSVGPRSCIGKPLAMAELRLLLARLVWSFDIEKSDTPRGTLEWDEQNVWQTVEKLPFEVKLSARRS